MVHPKILLCYLSIGLSSLSFGSKAPSSTPVAVTIDVPSPAWTIKISRIYTKANKLIVVCKAQKKEGLAAAVMSKAKTSVNILGKFQKLPREIYVTGQTWNYSKGYKAVTDEELEKFLITASEIYAPSKQLNEKSFIGLTLKEAQALAKVNKLPSRVIEIDGQPQITSEDYRPERFNFAIKNGKIIRVNKG
jgi:hypothetical protein|tara:strand:- start:1145 stop:1717 length:573 start_codon:yes stop_codon:yes gene_type:complete